MVSSVVRLVICGDAHLVTANVIPEVGAVIDVDWGCVVFPAADGNNLLAARNVEIVGDVPVEVSPVGALEKSVGETRIGRVDALTEMVAELVSDVAIHGDLQVFALQTMVGTVVGAIVVVGEIGAGVETQSVERHYLFFFFFLFLPFLRDGLAHDEQAS